MRIGVYVYGVAAVAYGITDLVSGEFDPSDQPLQAWGDHVPGATIFAYIAAIWLIVEGAALLWRESRRFAAASLAVLYGVFVLFPLPASIPRPTSSDLVRLSISVFWPASARKLSFSSRQSSFGKRCQGETRFRTERL